MWVIPFLLHKFQRDYPFLSFHEIVQLFKLKDYVAFLMEPYDDLVEKRIYELQFMKYYKRTLCIILAF